MNTVEDNFEELFRCRRFCSSTTPEGMAMIIANSQIKEKIDFCEDNADRSSDEEREENNDEEKDEEEEDEETNPKIRFLTFWLEIKPTSERLMWFQDLLDDLELDDLTLDILVKFHELAIKLAVPKPYR